MILRAAAHRALALTAVAALPLGAQVPRGADTLSAKSVAESLAVLKTLDAAVRANKNDAAAWFHQGMVAWALADRAKAKPPVGGLDQIKLERVADTSLRLAAEIAPTNPRYPLAAGVYLRYSNNSFGRLAATGYLDKAVTAARAATDPALLSTVTLEAGRVYWLRYDSEANRRNYACSPPVPCSLSAGSACDYGMPSSLDSATILGDRDSVNYVVLPTQLALKRLHNKLLECTFAVDGGGEADYTRAEELFRESLRASPDEMRVFRHLAMLLAEKNRWHELQAVAHDRTTRLPGDAWGWLTLGLAMHRSGQSSLAVAAFDTGMARLEPRERGRLFEFARLLTSRDSAAFVRSAPDARTQSERTFWAMAAPLWSRVGNDPRTEFLARVTFAELRWTVEEFGVRGADSDRGEIHIRYGPPDVISVLRGNDFPGDTLGNPRSESQSAHQALMPSIASVITFWDYDNGLSVVFWGFPTYGTAHFPIVDQAHIETIVEARPASFDNIAAGRVDEMSLNVTRFRAAGDSVDLLFASQAPVAAIRTSTSANTPVREDTWLFGRDVPNAYRDTVTLDASGLKAWTYRVPQSAYMYRVEASADGALVAGRAMTWVTAARDTATGFTMRGFGISDVLLATRADPRGTPSRWRDFDMSPLLGALPKQAKLELIWENYELTQRSGQAQYRVTLTIQREHSAAGRIAAAIVGALAGAVKVDRRDDRLMQQFDRGVAYAPTLVDHLSVALGDTPAGTYRLTLEISDAVSGRKTSRSAQLTIGDK